MQRQSVSLGLLMASCGSGDSTAAKTPTPPAHRPVPPFPESMAAAATTSTRNCNQYRTAPADPCREPHDAGDRLTAVSTLPPDPRSEQGWNPEPLEGNFSECARCRRSSSRRTPTPRIRRRVVVLHLGQFIPRAFLTPSASTASTRPKSTGDTVALSFCQRGNRTEERRQSSGWNGNGVELIGNTG